MPHVPSAISVAYEPAPEPRTKRARLRPPRAEVRVHYPALEVVRDAHVARHDDELQWRFIQTDALLRTLDVRASRMRSVSRTDGGVTVAFTVRRDRRRLGGRIVEELSALLD